MCEAPASQNVTGRLKQLQERKKGMIHAVYICLYQNVIVVINI